MNEYDQQSGQLIEQLTGFNSPHGLAVDKSGSLYVSDEGASRVVVFPLGSVRPGLVLADPGESPSDVAVSLGGEVAVANSTATSGDPGSVSFYRPLHQQSFKTLSAPFFRLVESCAYDARGNLYVDGLDAVGRSQVGEVEGGGSGNRIRNLNVLGIQLPGGIVVLKTGAFGVVDATGAAINTYAAGSNRFLAITLLSGAVSPVGLALMPNQKAVWTADQGIGATVEYTYPGGQLLTSIGGLGVPIGVAVLPAARP